MGAIANNTKQLSNIITKWKLNQTLLAEKMGMSRANLCRKLKGQVKFSEAEILKLMVCLTRLRTDLGEIDGYNDPFS
jgi:DNA-binding Xre family transcriptional regulator